MNKETRLLAVLDEVFGLGGKIKSEFRKIGQTFDEDSNEHVITIEYRIRRKGDLRTTRPIVNQTPEKTLLRQINDQVKKPESAFPLSPISNHSPTKTTQGR